MKTIIIIASKVNSTPLEKSKSISQYITALVSHVQTLIYNISNYLECFSHPWPRLQDNLEFEPRQDTAKHESRTQILKADSVRDVRQME